MTEPADPDPDAPATHRGRLAGRVAAVATAVALVVGAALAAVAAGAHSATAPAPATLTGSAQGTAATTSPVRTVPRRVSIGGLRVSLRVPAAIGEQHRRSTAGDPCLDAAVEWRPGRGDAGSRQHLGLYTTASGCPGRAAINGHLPSWAGPRQLPDDAEAVRPAPGSGLSALHTFTVDHTSCASDCHRRSYTVIHAGVAGGGSFFVTASRLDPATLRTVTDSLRVTGNGGPDPAVAG